MVKHWLQVQAQPVRPRFQSPRINWSLSSAGGCDRQARGFEPSQQKIRINRPQFVKIPHAIFHDWPAICLWCW